MKGRMLRYLVYGWIAATFVLVVYTALVMRRNHQEGDCSDELD